MTTAIALEWVPMDKYCELFNETPDMVDARLRRGHWLRGTHARVPAGSKQLWINIPAVNDWAAGKPVKPAPRQKVPA